MSNLIRHTVVALALSCTSLAHGASDPVLDATQRSKSAAPLKRFESTGPAVLNAAAVDLSLAGFGADSRTLTIRTATGESIVIQRSKSRLTEGGLVIWHGEVVSVANGGRALFVVGSEVITGSVHIGQRQWRLSPRGDGSHLMVELDAVQLTGPDASDVVERTMHGKVAAPQSAPKTEVGSEGGSAQIDILVAVDARAIPSLQAAQTTAQWEVEYANLAFSQSLTNVELRLVGTHVVVDTQSSDAYTQLQSLVSTSDGSMDTLHAIRDGLGADITVLLSQRSGGVCGIVQALHPSAEQAFAVVGYASQCDSALFAHEVGHLLSADHDTANACDNPAVVCSPENEAAAKTYAHGFVRNYTGKRAFESYATIMTYNNSSTCNIGLCMREHAFSNPSRLDDYGFPMGTINTHDNARAIAEEGPRVAAFRAPPALVTAQPLNGTWYNPERDGHGLSFSRAPDGGLVAGWFTYLADGTPTWYTTGVSTVNNGLWQTDLYKSTRYPDGTVLRSVVGNVELKLFNATSGIFSWNFDSVGSGPGFDGAEYMQHLFGGGIWTGTWFDPNEDGWGIALNNQGSEFVAAVFYYGTNGQPLWAVSEVAAGNASNLYYAMLRKTGLGLCPSCHGQAINTVVEPAGFLSLGVSAGAGHAYMQIQSHDQSYWIRGQSSQYLPLTRLTFP